ncbi:MAG: cytochrome c biogenesis protein CcsA [Gammaproteobacteria bacterium]|nr:cytochrome c biogenesis protein CcsA [Gammaproteobacteria bacterium]
MRFTGMAVLDLVLYCLAALALLLGFFRTGPAFVRERKSFAGSAAVAAVAIHTLQLYTLIFSPHGMDLGFFNTASLVGWLVALIALTTFLRPHFENLGIVLFPLAGISVVLAETFPGDRLLVPGNDWPLDAHIILSLIAYSLLSVAALQALLIAVQEYRLRRHVPGGVWSALPPLQIMERFLFQLLATGFILLTLALFTGLIFVKNLFAQHLVHKTVLSLLAWLVFAILLWGRWRFGWRGRTAIRWTLGGFVVLMLAYFGSKLVLELILGRHWNLLS